VTEADTGDELLKPRQEPYTDVELNQMGIQRERLPRHIAIIMDGNGRWAQKRMLPRIEGHRRGVTSVRRIVEECSRLALTQLTLYCFSNENWKRPKRELTLLMALLRRYLVEERAQIQRQGLRFRVIGRREELDPSIQKEIAITEELSRDNDGMTLCLAVNYGARQEIADAVRQIASSVASGDADPEDVSEQMIEDHLMTRGMTDPDLVIRTAGEMRISNFLLWQISYAELWVTQNHWPDFREADLRDAIHSFASRDRRFGGLKNSAVPAPVAVPVAEEPRSLTQ